MGPYVSERAWGTVREDYSAEGAAWEHFSHGQGLGAAHQTGWTALIANLVFRRYRQDIPEYWKAQDRDP